MRTRFTSLRAMPGTNFRFAKLESVTRSCAQQTIVAHLYHNSKGVPPAESETPFLLQATVSLEAHFLYVENYRQLRSLPPPLATPLDREIRRRRSHRAA